MTRYLGVVKNNRVEFEGDASLTDGTQVEILPLAPEPGPNTAETDPAERALVRDLLSAGILDQAPTNDLAFNNDFVPVLIQGHPLSEQIIEERR